MIHENAYINLIENAKNSVYICTPYLILDNTMESCLIRAAKSGIDVKIITPHHPDKKMVFEMTRSNYESLIRNGVEIYEFTPGFMHTKMIIGDGLTAIVGTCNFDFRSFISILKTAYGCINQRRSGKRRIPFSKRLPLRSGLRRRSLKMCR